MNNQVPSYYPPVPQLVEEELRFIDDIVVPACIEGDELSISTPRIGEVALEPSYAKIGHTLFTIYKSKEDCWEDSYYDAWYLSEDKQDEKLLTDLAILNVKNIDWWVV